MDALYRNGSKARKRAWQVMQEARAVRHGAYAVREYRNGEKRRSRTQSIPLPDASMVRLRSSSIPIKGSRMQKGLLERGALFLLELLPDYFTFKIPAIHEFDTSDIAVGYC